MAFPVLRRRGVKPTRISAQWRVGSEAGLSRSSGFPASVLPFGVDVPPSWVGRGFRRRRRRFARGVAPWPEGGARPARPLPGAPGPTCRLRGACPVSALFLAEPRTQPCVLGAPGDPAAGLAVEVPSVSRSTRERAKKANAVSAGLGGPRPCPGRGSSWAAFLLGCHCLDPRSFLRQIPVIPGGSRRWTPQPLVSGPSMETGQNFLSKQRSARALRSPAGPGTRKACL